MGSVLSRKWSLVLFLIFVMFLILVVAGGVFVYVAYPHRDQEVPGAPWLGDALRRGVDALPTLEDEFDRR